MQHEADSETEHDKEIVSKIGLAVQSIAKELPEMPQNHPGEWSVEFTLGDLSLQSMHRE